MRCFLGIDLGSTTSKAVLLDSGERVLGRGIINTRSSYDVAASVARSEAITDARFWLLAQRLEGSDGEQLATDLRRAYGVVQGLRRLRALRRRCTELLHEWAPREVARVEAIFAGMEQDADGLFGVLATDRTRFFRDLAGARYLADTQAAAERLELDFVSAASAYDRAIVEVENSEEALDFSALADAALSRLRLAGAAAVRAGDAVREAAAETLDIEAMVGTGYGRQRLPFSKECIRSEILCHGLGAHALFPATRTVLDIGGQDTKAIQLDADGLVTSFQMNDRCAAGCGRYLGYIADEMNLGLHELGPLALEGTRPARISSTCTVFAGVELRDLLSTGERRENILLGLHRAIILRAMSLLARSGGIQDEFTFTGGVARNPAAVRALSQLVTQHYGRRTLNIHTDSIFTGALGAALFALRAPTVADVSLGEEKAR